MAILNSFLYVYQRVNTHVDVQCRGCGAGAMSRAQDEVSTDFLRSCQGQYLVASEIVLFDIMK